MKQTASFPRLTHLLWSVRRLCDISWLSGKRLKRPDALMSWFFFNFCFIIIDVFFFIAPFSRKSLFIFFRLVNNMIVLYLLMWRLTVNNYSLVKVCHSIWICINGLPFSVIHFFVLDIYSCLKWFKDNSQCWSQFTDFCLSAVTGTVKDC